MENQSRRSTLLQVKALLLSLSSLELYVSTFQEVRIFQVGILVLPLKRSTLPTLNFKEVYTTSTLLQVKVLLVFSLKEVDTPPGKSVVVYPS